MKKKREKIRVLVAEDDLDILEVLIFQLSDAGYEVIEAKDGREAIKKVGFYRPHIILMDINMPKLNGIAACKLIKESLNVTLRHIPIVMLTALNTEEIVIDSIKAGASDYIIKPFSIEFVIQKIEEVLRKHNPFDSANKA